ncbi:hypothetical protein ABR737_01110 [Streptomyces sp. Edi2]|uniref:hypothetical protein n=1 Tax=Streptomyces sp. Edi2 TaxID=3162528 RepID=UPI003305D163
MAPTQPDPRRRPPRQLPQRRPPLTPKPPGESLFQAPRYTDPDLQHEIDEESAEVAPRSSFRR